MPRIGFVRQPGAPLQPRIVATKCKGRALALRLAAGDALLEGVRKGFAEQGFSSGVAELASVALGPFAYVTPALARNAANAAYYSPVFRPVGVSLLSAGALTFGFRDGRPFFHCHGLWREADGRERGGHILPEEAILAADCTIEALGLNGAGYEWAPDSEINFTVPGPAPKIPRAIEAPLEVHALRLRPNQDLFASIEAYCLTNGIVRARIRGGVGSIIGARFADGREVATLATEVFIQQGSVAPGVDGAPEAIIDIGFIDHAGRIETGPLMRRQNPVLMTMELALEVIDRR